MLYFSKKYNSYIKRIAAITAAALFAGSMNLSNAFAAIKVQKVTEQNTYYTSGYYNENDPLGVATHFHIFTNSLSVNVHTNGNIATRNMVNNSSNSGTQGLEAEISYIQDFSCSINPKPLASNKSTLVFGKNVMIEEADNGNKVAITSSSIENGEFTELDGSIQNIMQDDTAEYINFDKEFEMLRNLSDDISEIEPTYDNESDYYDNKDMNQRKINVDLSNSESAVIDLNPEILEMGTPLKINGYTTEGDKSIILNVDLDGYENSGFYANSAIKLVTDEGIEVGSKERTTWEYGKVLWNFYDSSESDGTFKGDINLNQVWFGSILAPDADVVTGQNFDGTVIANHYLSGGETHRLDFVGNIPFGPIDGFGTEITTETTTESTTKATTEATTESTTKATTVATTESTTKATTEVTTESTTEATTEATTESTTKATTEATTESTTKATTEATTESTTKATTVATTESTTKATTVATTESTTKATTVATTESTTKATTEATTESTTKATTVATTESTTEATTESTTEATTVETSSETTTKSNNGGGSKTTTTESTTEVTTEGTTEATTEVTTEGTTEATTEVTTEGTTEATTEVTTEGTTEATTEVTTEEITEGTTIEASSETTTKSNNGGGGGGSKPETTTEATTEGTTDVTAEDTTEVTTEDTTEATTEGTTDVTAEDTTEATTEGTTDVTTEDTTEATTEEANDDDSRSSSNGGGGSSSRGSKKSEADEDNEILDDEADEADEDESVSNEGNSTSEGTASESSMAATNIVDSNEVMSYAASASEGQTITKEVANSASEVAQAGASLGTTTEKSAEKSLPQTGQNDYSVIYILMASACFILAKATSKKTA